MATQWLRRAWLIAACATALLLASCGGGSIVSSFTPSRIIAFGDGMADLGQTRRDIDPNGRRFTVNDGSINNWTHFVANGFGLPLAPSRAGGLSFAIGNARVTATTDAAGNTGTPSVTQQIDAFLAANTLGDNDLVLVSAGTSDVIVQAKAVMDGTLTADQAQQNVQQAANELAAQVRRLVDAGASHVVVVGPYNLGRSAWAIETGQAALLERLSAVSGNTGANQPRSFDERLLIAMVDLGADVLYVDAALEYNLVTFNPGGFDLTNVTTPVCNDQARDPGPGIGTGANQLDSTLCTPSTIVAGADYTRFLFADRVYPTPHGHAIFGDFAFTRIRDRW
ncbi:SGNH/GDSL hydrolase family protein [Ramlibacter alkalitolerans]|uniref:SGNH/GDSL hydrolase family protein n=1 Tax=Ramlibacter alkalitolerans TaxID=2039631 RepID=A0ABS1JMW0_9BURK|nr:SGNH/GDSL hydrolase family protein [Ramlibacter alkalitolerans]MBL0425471.1 SGNH/GDSL hydrolase family protein [Ramlibacter alkalitolerans]